jgi:hypothetical protein
MNLRHVAAHTATAAVGMMVAGCGPIDFWNKPAAEASSREAAMDQCRRELDEKLPSFIERFSDPEAPGAILKSDEFTEIEITQSFCEASPNAKFKDMGYVMGYLEWLEKGTRKHPGETKVKKVIVSYDINYPLQGK